MITRLRSFHRDEQGQIIYLTVVSVVVFLSLAALIINSGNAVTRKLETQNAVDAAAVSGVTWIARGMNIISMNNVAMTEVLAITIILDALNETGRIGYERAVFLEKIAQAACNLGALVPVVGWAISAVGCADLPLVQSAKFVFEGIKAAKGAIDGAKTALWGMLSTLEAISGAVKTGFPFIGYGEATRIGRQNRAEGFVMYPPFSMPAERRDFSDFCHPTYVGSPSSYPKPLQRGYQPLLGYDPDEGPLLKFRKPVNWGLLLPMVAIFSPNLFRDQTETRFGELCRGSSSGDYSSPRSSPAPFLLKGAQRSTNRSTEQLKSVTRELNYLGIAWRATESMFMQARFINPQSYVCAYGQARVFNSTSFDLFTQDWRVKLVKADLLDTDQLARFTMATSCGNPSLMVATSLGNH